jgi:hypothetical protein
MRRQSFNFEMSVHPAATSLLVEQISTWSSLVSSRLSLRGAKRRSNPEPHAWRIASRSLSLAALGADPLARNDGGGRLPSEVHRSHWK